MSLREYRESVKLVELRQENARKEYRREMRACQKAYKAGNLSGIYDGLVFSGKLDDALHTNVVGERIPTAREADLIEMQPRRNVR